ncbi:hypothetical protein ACJU26_05710 [Acidithiobacillus sp. M4-SHS-6]|uniref:secretion/conjugation apparatus DotM-related subunit n=1 Tax=Acidithiobacillus sp. M4-SHS-6 TaxID=3383024 RepID=UPI0039BE7995
MSGNSDQQQNSSSDDDFFLMFILGIGAMLALYFFGKDIIIGYWKVMRLVDLWVLKKTDPAWFQQGFIGHALWSYLQQHRIPKISWNKAYAFNHFLDRHLSIGKFQAWPVFWSLLPTALALPLWNRRKHLKKTFLKPWDLALYMSKHYPWMLPVIRQRSAALKNKFRIPKRRSLSAVLAGLVQRHEKTSDWPLHPLTILLRAGAFVKNASGQWVLQDAAVEQWTQKQVGARAGREGFSTPERNALFHALVNPHTSDILKQYAWRGNKVIRKHTALTDGDVEKFKAYRKKHAYEVCILLSALQDARKKEIVPPNWFVWLKYQDRALWYALHGLGLPRPHPEGLPGLVQWHCELRQNGPVEVIQTPFVKSGLWDALEETQWQKSREWQNYVSGH